MCTLAIYLLPTLSWSNLCVSSLWFNNLRAGVFVFSSCRFVLFFLLFLSVIDLSRSPLFIFVLCCWSNSPTHYMDDLVDWMFFIYFFPFLLHPLSYADISIWYTLNQYVITLFLSFFFSFVDLWNWIRSYDIACHFVPSVRIYLTSKKSIHLLFVHVCV